MEIKRLLVRRLLVLIITLQWYKTTLTFNYLMVTISTVIDTRSRLQCIASIDEFHDKNCFFVRQLFVSIKLTFFCFLCNKSNVGGAMEILESLLPGKCVSLLVLSVLQKSHHFAATPTFFKSSLAVAIYFRISLFLHWKMNSKLM